MLNLAQSSKIELVIVFILKIILNLEHAMCSDGLLYLLLFFTVLIIFR